ncbi:MAG: amidohydrolase [Candidatus Rokuibacteriota bacterium]|nr:MAG: amidohydrolase [Candidatus Rokubacteria bacterium]
MTVHEPDTMARPGVARRHFLAGMAALGASVALPRGESRAQPAATKPGRIDVHHHLFPPTYVAEARARKATEGIVNDWTPEKSVEDMDRAGVAVAILSLAAGGVSFVDASGLARLARECNDYAAKLVADHPGRFGMFATMPLPNVEATLREIEYAFETLKADGVAFLTNYGDKWLGDPAFAPVMTELNRRRAVVWTHPTTANCCRNLVPDVPPSIVEWGTDTTRTIASLVFSGTAARCPDMKVIFSHGGGTMPFLMERFVRLPLTNKNLAARVPNGVEHELRKFYYDTAQVANPAPLAALLKVVPTSQVVFGTDFPYRVSMDYVKGLGSYGFSASDLGAIDRDNAVRLLPRFKA